MKTTKFHVVRVEYGVVNSSGAYHQTHRFSTHRTLLAAIKSFLKMQKTFNCVDIVDDNGKAVPFDY